MSIYRTALQASPEKIAALDDRDLNSLMLDLLKAQAYLAGANVAEVIVNTEGIAKDGGADGMSPTPPRPDLWLGDAKTCWQFKSGTAGQPAELRGEVLKPIPLRTLQTGGRYVVVCNASTRGEAGERDRLKILVDEATTKNVPTDRIEVIGSERLTTWCNQHPAVAASRAGRPEGVWRIDEWARSDEHGAEWQPIKVQQDAIARLRSDLDFASTEVLNLHVCGHPGVGKSRFALELCRGSPWEAFVIYVRQSADLRLAEMLDSCVADQGVRLVLVADEVQLEQLLPLRAAVGAGNGRIRLVTIGTSASPEPARIQAVEVRPLAEHEVTNVVRRWYPGMPLEHAVFVASFSAGYMRLARLAADAVHRNPTMDVRTILEQQDIKMFLDAMLGVDDRASLHVVAVLASVGWTEENAAEGKAIATHFGLEWVQVRRDVDRFHQRFQIAPRGGRLRYISPTPLGIYLALEAWRIYPSEMKSLPSLLSEAGVDAYYERLESLASSPQAGDFGREALDSFFPLADLNDARAIRRWSALAAADPGTAAARMRAELARRNRDERRAIEGGARRWLISGFVGLSWSTTTFDDATHALALLAEAENETYANNATGEFLHRFTMHLSGTATPYRERVRVLDELFATGSPPLRELAFRALGRIANRSGFRTHRTPITRGLPEPEWQPQTGGDYIEAFLLGVEKLRVAVTTRDPALESAVGEVVGELATILREHPVREAIADLFVATAAAFPEQREALRRRVAGKLQQTKKYGKEVDPSDIPFIEGLLRKLEDSSPRGKLREVTGPGSLHDDKERLRDVARHLAAHPDLLTSEWSWLTSGECRHAWVFGAELASVEIDALVESLLRSQSMGLDGRVASGYLAKRSESEGPEWLDTWLDALWVSAPERADFVLEASWSLPPTLRSAERVQKVIAAGQARRETIGQLAYSSWDEKLDRNWLRPILETLARQEHGVSVAVSMLQNRLSKHADELDYWSELALQLATTGAAIQDRQDDGYEWSELAKRIVDRYPRALYAAILEQQNVRDTNASWFLEHSLANGVAWACVERDPVGTWETTREYLGAEYSTAYLFTIGFPEGLVDQMDRSAILAWTAEDPVHHASLLAHVVSAKFTDDSLAGILVNLYADRDDVASAFHSRCVTGSWIGRASEHWSSTGRAMRDVARTTALGGLRRWATQVAESLEQMAERDRIREEEEALRGR